MGETLPPPSRRQSTRLLRSHKSVAENVMLPFLDGSPTSEQEAIARVDELLQYVGLAHVAAHYPAVS